MVTIKAELNGRGLNVVYSDSFPDHDSWEVRDVILNTNPQPGGSMGWVCTTAGTANSVAWSSGTFYTAHQQVNANGNVYECILSGTSDVTAPSGTADRIVDGRAIWKYVDTLAVFHEFGLISST